MLIILNHKMNLTLEEIKAYELILRDYDVVVMPQTPYMGLFTNGKYTLGSQCISEYEATGGVSGEALSCLNVKYVLVGHGERRNIKRDTDEVILKKIKESIKHNITPVLCIGENEEEKNNNKTFDILKNEIDFVFNNIKIKDLVIAYEPLWMIGKDQEIDPLYIEENINYIKKYVKEKYNIDIKVLYGGGINNKNISRIKTIKNLDGVLIGTASLDINNIIYMYNILK